MRTAADSTLRLSGLTVQAARRKLAREFSAGGIETPELDARLLVGFVLNLGLTGLVGRADQPLSDAQARRLLVLAQRRAAGEPVARIVGEKEFWGLRLSLSPDTLVPRPDTETVVEAALDHARASASPAPRIADIGTGSGAILLALLKERRSAIGIGVDRSEAAARIARANAEALGLSARAAFVCADWAGPIAAGGFDLLVSNPPYIASAELAALDPEVREHDPRMALDGGPDGLEAYRAILPGARRALRRGGTVALEIGETQGAAVSALVREHGFALDRPPRRDLGGRDRVIVAARP